MVRTAHWGYKMKTVKSSYNEAFKLGKLDRKGN